MQCAVIEYGRNVLNLNNAHSTEINPETPHPVIDIMEEQKSITEKGGTMRLGAYPCQIEDDSLAKDIYRQKLISERHRHRFEFNNHYLEQYQNGGMRTSGINPESKLVEIVEIPEHPFFIGVQFHPEYKSTVANPQPLFVGFVKAALTYAQGKINYDRNSITGIILIALLVVGYNIMYPPVIEENTTQKDSTSTTVIVEETIDEKSTTEVVVTNNNSLYLRRKRQ